jgi:hypothetical protein
MAWLGIVQCALSWLRPGPPRFGAAPVVALAALVGCSDPEPPDRIRLEVVAVQAEPPSGAPGTVVQLQLVHSGMVLPSPDAASVIDPSQVRVVWLGGCHNPPSGQYYGCLPMLRAAAEQLPSPLPAAIEQGAVPEGIFGVGESFALPIPDDILVETRTGLVGVSYAFFAACRGQLRPRPELTDTVPLACHGQDGHELGAEDFAVGFTTIRTMPGEQNANPVVTGLRLDGAPLERRSCATDDDCAELGAGALAYRCGSDGQCWPVIQSCDQPVSECEPMSLELVVSPESAEALPSGSASRPRETLRAEVRSVLVPERDSKELYPGSGDFATDTEFQMYPLPSDELAGQQLLPLLAVVRDSRGGTGWLWWSFLWEH